MEKIIMRSCSRITSSIVGWNSASVFRYFSDITRHGISPEVGNANAIPPLKCLING